jgi:hypothetical protein
VELVSSHEKDVSSAISYFPPFFLGLVVYLEANVIGDTDVTAEALALISKEVEVATLDHFLLFLWDREGKEKDAGVVVSELAILPFQARVVSVPLVKEVDAGRDLVADEGCHGNVDFREVGGRSLDCLPGWLG